MYKEGIHFMDYRTILQEENDAVRERLDLSMERVHLLRRSLLQMQLALLPYMQMTVVSCWQLVNIGKQE